MAVRQEAPLQRGPVIKLPEVKRRPSRTSKIIGPLILSGAVALSAFGVYELTQNNSQKPEQTPIAGGIGEPTPTASPEISITPSPEISPPLTAEPSRTPDLTFPGNLNSFTEGQIHKSPTFSDGRGIVNQNIIGDALSPSGGIDAAWFQGYLLGEEVIDNHLIAYVGLYDGKGEGLFFPINYGRLNNKDQNILDVPRININAVETKPNSLISVSQTQELLRENNGNNIAFPLISYSTVPDFLTKYRSGTELSKQSEITEVLMEWCMKNKKGFYRNTPMFPPLKKLINQRVTEFNPTLIPTAMELLLHP